MMDGTGATPIIGHLSQRRWFWATALLLPVFAYQLTFFLYPLLRILAQSIFDPGFTTRHFVHFFEVEAYSSILLTTFEVGFWVTAFSLLLGYPVAYMMANSKVRLASVLGVLVLLPFLTSILVRSFAWMVILGRQGLVNKLFLDLGLTAEPLPLMYNRTGVYIGLVQVMLPMMIFPLYSTMASIDSRYVRAAANLGAAPVRRFLTVYFPLSLPGVIAGCLLVFIQTLGFFITPALLGGRRDVMIAQLIELQINQLLNWGFASAIAIILLLATILIFLIYTRILGLDRLWGGGGDSIKRLSSGAGTRSAEEPRLTDQLTDFWNGKVKQLAPVLWLDSWTEKALGLLRVQPVFGGRAARGALWVSVSLILAYLMLPIVVIIIASFSDSTSLEFPPSGFSLHLYQRFFEDDVWIDVTVRSFKVAALVMCLAMLLGTPAAFSLVRSRIRGAQLFAAFIVAPMILPVIVTSLAVYYFFTSLQIIGTDSGLVLGHTLLATPLVLIIVSATLRTFDPALEHASQSLGATPLRTFLLVTVPIIRPGLVTAATFAFLVSFDELIITMFISGVQSTTLPKQMWDSVHDQVDGTLASVSSLLIFVTIIIMSLQYWVRGSGSRRRVSSESSNGGA